MIRALGAYDGLRLFLGRNRKLATLISGEAMFNLRTSCRAPSATDAVVPPYQFLPFSCIAAANSRVFEIAYKGRANDR